MDKHNDDLLRLMALVSVSRVDLRVVVRTMIFLFFLKGAFPQDLFPFGHFPSS